MVQSILLQDLIDLKVPSEIIMFIKNVSTERKVDLYANGRKVGKTTSKRVPQGSVLNHLLFNIYVHNLEKHMSYPQK